ncbi:hypothetical protein EK904_000044 [Melospiza melodia maxima]|nr:hypothetical protein EK904_000044 [Melospiza melodia maxima]
MMLETKLTSSCRKPLATYLQAVLQERLFAPAETMNSCWTPFTAGWRPRLEDRGTVRLQDPGWAVPPSTLVLVSPTVPLPAVLGLGMQLADAEREVLLGSLGKWLGSCTTENSSCCENTLCCVLLYVLLYKKLGALWRKLSSLTAGGTRGSVSLESQAISCAELRVAARLALVVRVLIARAPCPGPHKQLESVQMTCVLPYSAIWSTGKEKLNQKSRSHMLTSEKLFHTTWCRMFFATTWCRMKTPYTSTRQQRHRARNGLKVRDLHLPEMSPSRAGDVLQRRRPQISLTSSSPISVPTASAQTAWDWALCLHESVARLLEKRLGRRRKETCSDRVTAGSWSS